MFALTVKSLDGSCRRLHLGPENTLWKLRQQLEEGLPELHEVRLFQGERELQDADLVEVELQGVVTKSPGKALAVLEARVEHLRSQGSWHEGFGFEVLAECGRLCPAYVERLLALTVHSGATSKLREALAVAFAVSCGDPAGYVQTLMDGVDAIGNSWRERRTKCEALVQLVVRCGDSLPKQVREHIVQWAAREAGDMDKVFVFPAVLCLLAHLGDTRHKDILSNRASCRDVVAEAALRIFEARQSKQVTAVATAAAAAAASDSTPQANDADREASAVVQQDGQLQEKLADVDLAVKLSERAHVEEELLLAVKEESLEEAFSLATSSEDFAVMTGALSPNNVTFDIVNVVQAHSLVGGAYLNGLRGRVVMLKGDRVGVDFGDCIGKKAVRPESLRLATDLGDPLAAVSLASWESSVPTASSIDVDVLAPTISLQQHCPHMEAHKTSVAKFASGMLAVTLANMQCIALSVMLGMVLKTFPVGVAEPGSALLSGQRPV